jgi:hypothetical protein
MDRGGKGKDRREKRGGSDRRAVRYYMFIPKQGEFHCETKQIERLRRVTCKHESSGVLYAGVGLLLPVAFHAASVGADADVDEGD